MSTNNIVHVVHYNAEGQITESWIIPEDATATLAIKDGIIHTEDFDVAGKLFDMVGSGEIYFLDDKLDFDIRINAKGAGIVLAPVYKLFEYKGEGTLSKPDWHPKRF